MTLLQQPIRLNKADFRFLSWLAHFCSPFGTTIGKKSTVTERLLRHGLIERSEKKVVLTGIGWKALFENGYKPRGLDGYEYDQLVANASTESR